MYNKYSTKKTEQNRIYFKRVHSTLFSTLTYTTYNTRDKGRKKAYKFKCTYKKKEKRKT